MLLDFTKFNSPLVPIDDIFISSAGIKLFIKRDDLIHPEISGNKWRKLKYNLNKTPNLTIVTFGGAYSNHLFAVASACFEKKISSVGIVRGDELNPNSSPTLMHCSTKNMKLFFVNRQVYKQKEANQSIEFILSQLKSYHIIPEGGANEEGVKGMAELPQEITHQLGYKPDYLAIASGTGSSAAGLLRRNAHVIAFPVLKGGDFLRNEIIKFAGTGLESDYYLDLQTDFHFGGYGKYTPELLEFIIWFEKTHGIPLEQVYTGKMLFGLYELIKKKYFPKGSTLVAIHTGGIQGRLKTLPDTPLQTDFQ